MNKIYKVVWSKAKHCYVVTSELAKRQTKGCGARSLRMATVSLSVAASLLCAGAVLPIFGESVAEAKTTTEKQGNKIINTTTDYTTVFNFQYPEKSVTIGATEINEVTNAHGVFGNVAQRVGQQMTDNVSFKVIDGQLIEIHDVNQYYLEPYQRVLTGHPFKFSNGTDSDIDDEIKNSDGAKSDVSGYSLTITGGTLQEVAGGLSNGGNVSNNTININDGTINKAVYGGYTTQSGNVSNNTVNLNGGIIKGTVYGGYSEDGVAGGSTAAEGNKVNITGGKVNSFFVYGGYSQNSNANFNAVTISGGEFWFLSSVYGGSSNQGNASNNSVSVSGGSLNDISGGSGNGNADNNTVTVTGGTLMYVSGGHSTNGTANNNTIDISGGTIGSSDEGGSVVGAYHAGGGASTADNNIINIYNNAIIIGNVAGAKDNYGYALASGNTITIDGSAVVTGNVAGVSGWGKKKQENKVFIKNGSVTGDVYGGLLEYEYASEGSLIKNEVNISGGTVTGDVYAGAVKGNVIGDVKENKVNITGGTLTGDVYGGVSASGNAQSNEVNISGGTVNKGIIGGNSSFGKASNNYVNLNGGKAGDGYEAVYGGTSRTGNSDNNHVNINGGTANGSVYGGQSKSTDSASGDVTGNTVTITKGAVTGTGSPWICGGYTWGKQGGENASGKAEDNTVTISGGTLSHDTSAAMVYGGLSNGGDAIHNIVNIEKTFAGMLSSVTGGDANNNATKNEVTIAGGTVSGKVYGGQSGNGTAGGDTANDGNKVTISGATVRAVVYGGYTYSGDAKYNSVAVSGSGQVNNTVYGGCSENGGKAIGNTVTLDDSAKVMNGITGGWSPKSDAVNNTITVNNGTVSGYINGGVATGTAKENHIIVNNGTVSYLQGGSGASATGNTIEVNNGTVSDAIYAGYTENGTAGGDTANDGNKVTISGGMVEGFVYGSYTNSGNAKYNTVTISGNGVVNKAVYGGYSYSGAATDNTVSIEGGTVNANVWGGQGASSSGNKITMSGGIFSGLLMIGGIGTSGSGDGNTVTISGGTFSGSNYNSTVQGGAGKPGSLNNTVNLTSTVTGLENVGLFGGGDSDNYSGNELHVGGTKDGTVTGVWQGKTGDTVNNKVKTVARFDKVVLHSVKWDKDVAALEATSVNNVKTLDITDLKFYTDAEGTTQKTSFTEGESMALLKSVESDLSSVKLDYKSGDTVETVAITTEGVTLGGGATDKTETDGVNGVKLTQSVTEKVKLATDSKAISYSCEVGDVKGVTFGTMTWGTGRTAEAGVSYAAVTDSTVDATNLLFANPEAAAPNTTMKMLSGAKDLTAGTDITGHTQTFDHKLANNVSLNATLTGTVVRTTAGEIDYKALSTTVNSVDLVDWNGSDATFDATGWTKSASAAVETAGLSVTVDPGVEKTVLTVSGVDLTGITVNGEAYQWKDGGESIAETSAKNGVKITAGETTGGGIKGGGIKGDGNKIIYKGSSKTVTGLEVTNVDFVKDGVAREFKNDYDLTNAAITVASGITISNTEAMNTGDTMVVVDATDAIKVVGEATRTLQDFATAPAPITVAFKDEKVDGKELTFEGTHNDTLSLNDDKNKVLYTVGDKNVNKATFTGEVAWNDSEAYYTNDASKYKFGATDIDATNLKVTGTTERKA